MANQFNTTTHYTQTTSDNTPSQAIDEAVQAIARNAQAPLDMARQCVMGALDYNTQTTSNAPTQSQAIDEAVQAIARNAQVPLDMARQCVMGALDYNTQTTSDNTPAPELDSNTLAYIQRLESENQQLKDRLKRQRINHSDSITTSICHLEYIKANLQALESVTFDNNPNFEDSQEYLLFASLNYLIDSYIKDHQSEQNQLGQGGNHASL